MDPEQAVELYRRGQDLWDRGLYEAAAETLKQAEQKTERQIDGITSTAKRKELEELLLEIRDWCATVLHEVGDYGGAVVYNRRNLEARIHSPDYGLDSEDTLDNRRRLVENYTALGQYDLAITECRSILKVVDGSPDRNTLAQSLFRRGGKTSMQEAVNINLYTLKRDETLLGRSDFSLCRARHNLGVELCELEKFEEARTFLSENVAILDGSSRSDSSKERSLLLRDSREALARCAEMEAAKRASEKKAEEEAERRAQEEKARYLAALEREQLERERLEKERKDRKRRLEQEALLKARLEEERLKVERLHKRREREEREEKELQERKEAERKEKERQDRRRKERERREQEQKEQEQKEQEQKEQEQKVQEQKASEKKEQEQKASKKKEQERRASEKKDQEQQKKSNYEKKTELESTQDANPRKRHVRGSEPRQTTPEPPKASPKKPSITSQPAAPTSEQKHKRTTSEPSKQEPKPRSTHSRTSSSLQDVRDSLLPPVVENRSKASGRRRSTSDIASLNTNERPPSAAKSTVSKTVASDLPAEAKASTKSTTINIPKGVPSRKYTKSPSTSDIASINPEERPPSVAKSTASKKVASDLPAEPKTSKKSPDGKPTLQSDANGAQSTPRRRVSSSARAGSDSGSVINIPTGVPSRRYTKSPDSEPTLQSDANGEQNAPKRQVSSSARVRSDSASSIGTVTTTTKDQKRSNRSASAQSMMPGSWPTDINDTSSNTKAQPHHSTGDIPRITYDNVDTSNQTRRTHSNETLRETPASLAPERSLSRASSVGRRQRPNSVGGNLFGSVDPNSPGTRADLWFENLRDTAHRFLDTYKDYVFDGQRSPYKNVKIAVLDTGVANSSRSGTPKIIKISKSRITWCKVAGNPLEPRDDEDGHGTQVASIILQVTPYARLYVYRITRGRGHAINRKDVAAAIEDAILKHDVDIINMSFGWEHEYGEGQDELRAALAKCYEKDVLVFAATSNEDVASVSGMAYPARDKSVIAIDAATSKGEWLSSNPSRDYEHITQRFTALGEAIKTDAEYPRMDGTSAASPVAAGIAALILEFARQPPLGYAPNIAKWLRRSDAMREVLAGALSVKHTRNGEYRHLVPGKLFKCDAASGDAGDWFSLRSRRHDAVELIGSILKRKYGHEILHPVHQRIEQHWARGGAK